MNIYEDSKRLKETMDSKDFSGASKPDYKTDDDAFNRLVSNFKDK